MLTIVAMLSAAQAAPASDAGLAWDWSVEHRFFLESEVRLPYLMWFAKQFNEQARVSAFRVRVVADCVPGDPGRRVREVLCDIEDVSLTASGVAQEEGLLQPILEELDERLSGATVQLQVRDDGRLVNIDMEDLDRRNRRVGRMNENLRLVVSRAFAGLDLPLPPNADDPQWVQHDAWLMKAPAAQGSIGSARIVHNRGDDDGRLLQIVTGGRAIIVPALTGNQYAARMTSEAWFDRHTGALTDRSWTVIAAPTPSSAIAEGTAGYPYLQVGHVVALAPDQSYPVGASEALPPLDEDPSAIQQWQTLGLIP